MIPDHADAKICDLNISVEIDQDIFWFNITVNNSNAVEGCDTNGLKMSLRKSVEVNEFLSKYHLG